jgi:hypothetical protein
MPIYTVVDVQGWLPPLPGLPHLAPSSVGVPQTSPCQGSPGSHKPRDSSCPRVSLMSERRAILPHLCPICDTLAFPPETVELEDLIQQEEVKKPLPPPSSVLHSHPVRGLALVQILLLYPRGL